MPKDNIYEYFKKIQHKRARILSLIVTKNCNLKCTYCYEKHDLRDKEFMDISVAKEAIIKYMTADDNYDLVQIEFFGGEPLIGFNFIREIVDWFHTHEWGKKHIFFIGTNGTILTSEIKNWLLENKSCINVAVSIDGKKEAHDISRDKSYDMVLRNIPFFIENWPHQPAKMTVCAETIPYVADGVIELEEMGINFTANIGFEDFWGDRKEKKRLLAIYEEQLSRLVDFYAKRTDLYPIKPMLGPIPDSLGIPKLEYHKDDNSDVRFCGAGHEMVVVDIDGKTYPCHRFLPWVSGRSVTKTPLNCQKAWKPVECAQCKLIDSCPTCAGYNLEVNGDTGIRTTFHCEAYKAEVLSSATLEAMRLRNRLSEIHELPQQEKRKIKTRLEAILELIENGI